MPSFNKVFLMGNLTRDPELRYTANNQAVCNIGLAVNRRYTTSDGQQREEVTFVDCEAWARRAEIINQYLSKGKPVFIEGRLKLDTWEDQQGQKRSKLCVVIDNFQFIDTRGTGIENHVHNDDNHHSDHDYDDMIVDDKSAGITTHQPIDDEDIPF